MLLVLFQQDDPLKKHISLLHKDTSLSLKVKLLKKIICVERLYYRFFYSYTSRLFAQKAQENKT